MSGAGQDSCQTGAAGAGKPLKRSHQVTILGQQYTLRTEASPEQVQEVVDFVRRALAEVSGRQTAVDSLDAAVLALLNVAGSYLQLRKSSAHQDQRLDRLLEKVSRSLLEDPGEKGR